MVFSRVRIQASSLSVVGAALLFSLSGCLATSSEIMGLRDDMHEFQVKMNELQRNQADLSAKMDTMTTAMKPLSYELQETQSRMSLLGQRLDDVESNIAQRVNKLSEQMSGSSLSVAPPPSELYRLAYSDFSRGKYDLAVVGFKTYLEKYPQGELASQAQYYLGECYYSQNDWEQALNEFELVEKTYAKSNSVPAARLKRALCLELMGQTTESREAFMSLVKDYPDSPEAFTAQEKIKTYQTNNGK
jgi:tol-pal system protein YbgF